MANKKNIKLSNNDKKEPEEHLNGVNNILNRNNIYPTLSDEHGNTPPEVTTTVPLASTRGPAVSSSNYLPVNGIATPGDRGDEKVGIGPMVDVTSGGLPAADLREAEGEVNRRAPCNGKDGTTSGGTAVGKEVDVTSTGSHVVLMQTSQGDVINVTSSHCKIDISDDMNVRFDSRAELTDIVSIPLSTGNRSNSLDGDSFIDSYNTHGMVYLGSDEFKMHDGIKHLKEMMIYKTVQFMDYRRLRRRLSGIRKPVSNKKALFVCLFCIILAVLPFIYFHAEEDYYIAGLQIPKGPLPYVSALGFALSAFLLAKIQLGLQLKWPIIISYIFMFTTLITMSVMRWVVDNKLIWLTLIVYTGVQIFVIAITKFLTFILPLLALNGLFFPCTEHFHLLQRSYKHKKLNVTISRYNDYTAICGVNFCGLCTCFYRCMYRWFRWCYIKYSKSNNIDDGAPFSHQMRYNGGVDTKGLPHGYGEWLEDHVYGERLRGYWWHGYPIGPFSSQEIGSGSIFVNTRVAFITNTQSSINNIKFGVACTECSISGYFFKEMPKTYFFNPMYQEVDVYRGYLYSKIPYFSVLSDDYTNISGSSIEWCIKMMRLQFF